MKGVYNNLDEIVKLIIGKKCVSCGKTFEIGNFVLQKGKKKFAKIIVR